MACNKGNFSSSGYVSDICLDRLPNSQPILTFKMAIKNGDGGLVKIPLICFGRMAEIAHKFLAEDMEIFCSGFICMVNNAITVDARHISYGVNIPQSV